MTRKPTAEEIAKYYDQHAMRKYVRNRIRGNPRIALQYEFVTRSLDMTPSRVVVLGCGPGELVKKIARRMPRNSHVLGIDISEYYVKIAKSRYRHSNTEFRVLDITEEPLEGEWDYIILPDVYEHVPADKRPVVHKAIANALSTRGQVLVTAPSPEHQEWLLSTGGTLQPVDEKLDIDSYQQFAKDVGGALTFYKYVSAFHENDYVHVCIERNVDSEKRIETINPIDRKRPSVPVRLKLQLQRFLWSSGFTKIIAKGLNERLKRQIEE